MFTRAEDKVKATIGSKAATIAAQRRWRADTPRQSTPGASGEKEKRKERECPVIKWTEGRRKATQ